MCGIAGKINVGDRHAPPSRELLTAMVRAIRHRGPDEYGMYRDARAGLVHARLSLIDLTSGQQPLSNEDGTLWIVFNGEIFNYVELRRDLEPLGHRFRTHSDTEVIVHAYEAWGNDCFRRFNGQWALALWDSRARRLVLARDRIGVRPLYAREAGGHIWFASEVKAMFADPDVPRAIDPAGLDQTFTYWTSIAPTSLFRGIEEILPGSVRTYEPTGAKRDFVFWRPSYPVTPPSDYPLTLDEATEALAEKLETATRLRMLRADVPVGSYLSGGLDSSLTAVMGRRAKDGVFRTYSIRFQDAEYDETEFQRAMAATIDSDHQELVVSRRDIANVFPEVIRHTERPILRTAPAPLYLLSRIVRDSGIKAVLTGEGADEMLAGYDIFRESEIRHFWSREPGSAARPMLFDRLYPYLARSPQKAKGMALEFWKQGLDRSASAGFSHDPRWRTTSQLKRFYAADMRGALAAHPAGDVLAGLPEDFTRWDTLSRAQYLEVVTLLSGYLISSQGDRMLMAHSVEGRFPFLDSEVMEFCNALPPNYKLAGLNEKFILKRAAAGRVPEKIINRPKQPYRAPDAVSFVEQGAPEYVREAFTEGALRDAGLFDPAAAGALYAKCVARTADGAGETVFSNADNMALVGLLSAQLLHRQFIRGDGAAPGGTIEYKTLVDRVPIQQLQGTA
ncbi:MAG TPA: asparagine synthase (glutamine-hydrolyzing) [Bacteroidota bacterium]|nr:asparagine synthase (glutamine-hydrolyzing) [Bacteroidota bacterium]